MSWRLAESLEKLRAEVNAAAPDRSKRSDGTIGDTAHAASASDHNPNPAGVVCALDLTHDPESGADMYQIAAHLVRQKHPALKYVIFGRKIASRSRGWEWRYYGGSNPHTSHMHVSVGRGGDGQSTGPYDDTSPWGISSTGGDIMSFLGYGKGDTGSHIRDFQKFLSDCGYPPAHSFAKGEWDGIYGSGVAAAVLECRIDNGSEVDPNGSGGDKVNYWANNQLRRAHAKAMIKRFAK